MWLVGNATNCILTSRQIGIEVITAYLPVDDRSEQKKITLANFIGSVLSGKD